MEIRFEQPFENTPGTRARGAIAHSPANETFILQSDSVRGPTFYAESVSVTEETVPGGVVDVEVTLANERTSTSLLNPDYCSLGAIDRDGVEGTVTVDPVFAGTPESDTVCVGPASFTGTPGRETLSYDFTAPTEPGTYTVSVTVESNAGGGTVDYLVVVVDGDNGREDPPDRGNGDNGDNGDNGFDFPTLPGGGVDATSGLAILVLVLVLFLVVAVVS